MGVVTETRLPVVDCQFGTPRRVTITACVSIVRKPFSKGRVTLRDVGHSSRVQSRSREIRVLRAARWM